jgi:hypothetical protein
VRVLVLAEIRVFRCYADVRNEEDFVRHIPGIAMHRDNQRLGERRFGPPERVDEAGSLHHRLSRLSKCLVSVDIDTSGEAFAVAEQNRCTQRGISIVLVVGSRQALCRLRVQPIVDARPVDADQHDVAFALDGDLRPLTVRNVRHRRGLVRL